MLLKKLKITSNY